MASVVYSKMEGKNDPLFGKFEHPIKAIIENESNILEKEKNVLTELFNVEKSNRYSETVFGESDFDTFQASKEGQRAENDSIEATYNKTITHTTFRKEFTITREMAEDAKFGMGSNMKNAPKRFYRAYHKTKIKLASYALINATASNMTFNKAKIDLTCQDKLPLFHNKHTYATDKMKGKTQCNYFYGSISTDAAVLEKTLGRAANLMRNFKDENGEVMGYVANTIIIPCNRPDFENMVKKVVGSERTVGSNNNDINTQYGNWTIVVLPYWESDADEMMIMSSDANESLLGNMFYNRTPLDITSEVDGHTRDYYWNGYCRMSVGFNSWKHILRIKHSTAAVTNANALS